MTKRMFVTDAANMDVTDTSAARLRCNSTSRTVTPRAPFATNASSLAATKAFPAKNRLLEHHKGVHGESRFKCTEPGCKKDFPIEKSLRHHMQGVYIEKDIRHKCTEPGCDKEFASRQSLRLHEDTGSFRMWVYIGIWLDCNRSPSFLLLKNNAKAQDKTTAITTEIRQLYHPISDQNSPLNYSDDAPDCDRVVQD